MDKALLQAMIDGKVLINSKKDLAYVDWNFPNPFIIERINPNGTLNTFETDDDWKDDWKIR